MTWWEADRNCELSGGQLFVPETEDDVDMLMNTIDDEFHWIGGLTFISWKWSCDDSAFYKSVCQSEVRGQEYNIIKGNSAYKCYQTCGRKFGLQGEHCYCLGSDTHTCMDISVTEMRCRGNFNDSCGTDNRMSVYDMEIGYESRILPSQRCVYAKLVERESRFQWDYCSTNRSMAGYTGNGPNQFCEGEVAVTKNKLKDWDTWYHERKLLKVTNSSIDDLTNKMLHFDATNDKTTYWIGLRGYLVSSWLYDWKYMQLENILTETEMPLPDPEDYGLDELCLVVRKPSMSSSLSYRWTVCGPLYKSVCRKDNHITLSTASTTESSAAKSTKSTVNTEHATSSKSTSRSSVTSAVTSTMTSPVTHSVTPNVTLPVASSPASSEKSTRGDTTSETSSNNGFGIGLYVGLPIGNVLIIGVIIGFILIRNRRLQRPNTEQTHDGNIPRNAQSNLEMTPTSTEYDTLHVYVTPNDPSLQYETIRPSVGMYVNIQPQV